MTVTDALRILGGVAARSVLLGATSRATLARDHLRGSVVRIARGRYALPEAHEGLVVATRAAGVVCLASAALSSGWAVKTVPEVPHVALPKHRRLADGVRRQRVPHWMPETSRAPPPARPRPWRCAGAGCPSTRRWRSRTRPCARASCIAT